MVFCKHTLPLVVLLLAADAQALEFDQLTLELAGGFNHTRETELLLLGVTKPTSPFLGVDTYTQLNLGGWAGRYDSATIGAAKGLQWRWGDTRLRVSLGASFISKTQEDRLSTAFQFYEQLAVQRPIGNLRVALSYRHWSNARIKQPNGGMNFLGVELEHRW